MLCRFHLDLSSVGIVGVSSIIVVYHGWSCVHHQACMTRPFGTHGEEHNMLICLFLSLSPVTWLKYCRYNVKLYPINQSINQFLSLSLVIITNRIYNSMFYEVSICNLHTLCNFSNYLIWDLNFDRRYINFWISNKDYVVK